MTYAPLWVTRWILRRIYPSDKRRLGLSLFISLGLVLTYLGVADFGVQPPNPLRDLTERLGILNNTVPVTAVVDIDPGNADPVQRAAVEAAANRWTATNPGLEVRVVDGAASGIAWSDGWEGRCDGPCTVHAGNEGCGSEPYIVTNNAMHAIGHVLGIGHTSIEPSVMVGPLDGGKIHVGEYEAPRKHLYHYQFDSENRATGQALVATLSMLAAVDQTFGINVTSRNYTIGGGEEVHVFDYLQYLSNSTLPEDPQSLC